MMKNKACLKKGLVAAMACFLWMPAAFAAELSVDEAIQMALEKNTDIKISAKGEEKAQANLEAAEGAKGLSVDASAALSVADGAAASFSKSNSNSISLSLPVYSGGAKEITIQNKRKEILSSQLNTERTRENIRLDVIKAYYDVLEKEKETAVNQESVDNYQAHLTNVEQLYAAGSKAKVEVLRSEVELSAARQTLIKAQNAYELAVSTLKNIIKLDRDEKLTLTEDFQYQPFAQAMGDCLSYAQANRKDLQQDQYAVEEAENQIKIAKAGWLPTVNVVGGLDWKNQPLPDGDHYAYSAGVTASWNLFDSQVTKANVKAAEIAADTARLTLAKDQDEIALSVQQAYLNMKEAEKRFTSTQDAVKKAREDYYIANEKYRAGEGLMLDIIDAQLALSTAELNYISAQYDYARYKATLENEMGLPR